MPIIRTPTSLNCSGRLLDLSSPIVMGILNATPDSFYVNSRSASIEEALRASEKMIQDGADVIDIGGHSTRPKAQLVSIEDEVDRTIPVIEALTKSFPEAIISIDTFNSEVARRAVDAGASIINDISGGTFDDKMFEAVADSHTPYILGHVRGTFETMMDPYEYQNITGEVFDFFTEKIDQLTALGVNDIVIDPCFGFSKSLEQNYELLKNLSYFVNLERPLLVGFSRKSMINKLLQIKPAEALNGTTVLNTIGLTKGASILRVHDVKEAVEAIKIYKASI